MRLARDFTALGKALKGKAHALGCHVQLTGQLPSALILSSGDGERLAVKTELPRFVLAPVSAGETLGRVRYYLDGREVTSVPLTAAYGVDARPAAGAFGRWLRALRELTEAFFRL